MGNQRRGLLMVSGGLLCLALVMLPTLIHLGGKEAAWSSHHAQLVAMIDRCPGQHYAAREAVADGVLGLREGRRLIENCTVEILQALPSRADSK